MSTSTLYAERQDALIAPDTAPVLGFVSLGDVATLTASSTASGDVQGIVEDADFEAWAADPGAGWVEFETPADVASYVATRGLTAPAQFEYHDGIDWQFLCHLQPGTDLQTFGAVTASRWRLVGDGLTLGVIKFGLAVCIPCQPLGWVPPTLRREVKRITQLADGGAYLGTALRRKHHRIDLVARRMQADFGMNEWRQFIEHIELRTAFVRLFYAGRPVTYYVWQQGDNSPVMNTPGQVTDRIPLAGRTG